MQNENICTEIGLRLFRYLGIPKFAINLIPVEDTSEDNSELFSEVLQIREMSNPHWHVILNFDLEGRILNVTLGTEALGNEISLLERGIDGKFYVYYENFLNLQKQSDNVYYYYDYYNQKVTNDTDKAKKIIELISIMLDKMKQSNYTTSSSINFIVTECKKGLIKQAQVVSRVNPEYISILENARTKCAWKNFIQERKKLEQVYITPLDVLPPEVRPDINPVFAIIQVSHGCRLRSTRGACSFCRSYENIHYREKDEAELRAHISRVRNMTGKGWAYVKKIFLADGDPLFSENTIRNLHILAEEIPQAQWYSAFVSTPTIFSMKDKDMQQQGVNLVYWGVESGDGKILDLLEKPQTITSLVKAADILHSTKISFIPIIMSGLGLLSMQREGYNSHIEMTADLIGQMKPKAVYISRFTLLRGTRLFERTQKGKLSELTEDALELQHRLLIKAIKSTVPSIEIRGGYGSQFVVSETAA
jgi:hypothetical protein